MRKYLALLIVGGALFWIFYLPVPWDQKSAGSTFYIREDNTPLYSCPSEECEIIGMMDRDGSWDVGHYDSYEELPEWVKMEGKYYVKKSAFINPDETTN